MKRKMANQALHIDRFIIHTSSFVGQLAEMRVVFKWQGEDALEVAILDYH